MPAHAIRFASRRADIQALRAIAVVAVLLFHLWPNWLPGGFTGVDIFFVISGFLMTAHLFAGIAALRADPAGRRRRRVSFLLDFYARRIKRLVPAATLVLVSVLIALVFVPQADIQQRTARQVVASALLVQNWELAHASVDYLAPSRPPTAVQHFWSLSLEEQFYLAWPALLLLVALGSWRWSVRRSSATLGVVTAITLGSFAYCVYATATDPAQAYFVTPTRLWELSLGGVVALAPALAGRWKPALSTAGLALCVASVALVDGNGFPGLKALVPTLGAAAVLWAGTDGEPRTPAAAMLSRRPVQAIGDASYSLYLWHWPLIVLTPLILGRDLTSLLRLAILGLAVALAFGTYRFVEQPTQRVRLRRGAVYATAAALVLSGCLGGVAVVDHAANRVAASQRGQTDLDATCLGAQAITHRDQCRPVFGGWTPAAAERAKNTAPEMVRRGPHVPCKKFRLGRSAPDAGVCRTGARSSDHRIVVWGDSHATQYWNTFDEIGRDSNVAFDVINSGPCAADLLMQPDCTPRRQAMAPVLTASDGIVVSLLAKDDANRTVQTLEWLRSVAPTLPIRVIEDVPLAGPQSGPDCGYTGKTCRTARRAALATPTAFIDTLIQRGLLRRADVIRTSDLFCDQRWCYAYIGGLSVYHDTDFTSNSHVSVHYALSMTDALEERFRAQRLLD